MNLSGEEKHSLIHLARDAIFHQLKLSDDDKSMLNPIPEFLKVKCGAFVSLYVENKLRGCIGTFSEEETLFSNVRRMAKSAAAHDSRFAPVTSEETGDLKIEISVLFPRKLVTGPDEIEIGRHGIFIEQGSYRGTLLPQVALNQNWTAEEFLGHCAQHKAGIGWDGWKSAQVYTYEALVFDSDTDSDSA